MRNGRGGPFRLSYFLALIHLDEVMSRGRRMKWRKPLTLVAAAAACPRSARTQLASIQATVSLNPSSTKA